MVKATRNEPGTSHFSINISQVFFEKKGVSPLTQNSVHFP